MKKILFSLAFLNLIFFSCTKHDFNDFITKNTGYGISLAIIDTGFNEYLVSSLSNRIILKYNASNDNDNLSDNYSHSTSILAIGCNDNDIFKINGISKECNIILIKAYNDFGLCNDALLAKSINIAINYHANVINISLGLYSASPLIDSAIINAKNKNIIVVASSGEESSISSPASNDYVISVGQRGLSKSNPDVLIDNSNYESIKIIDEVVYIIYLNGSSVSSIILAAVIVDILSTNHSISVNHLISNVKGSTLNNIINKYYRRTYARD
jgi:hypothetical protein